MSFKSMRRGYCALSFLFGGLSWGSAGAVEFKTNVFASIVAGEITKGDKLGNTGSTECPCFIADWGNGYTYAGYGPTLSPESRAGAQVKVDFTDKFSATVQGVARTGRSEFSLEWAYLSYDITSDLTLQLGRKRIPIFYYSDFQDIGYAYIWVRPPGELYGWDMNNYEGASLRYRLSLGDWTLNSSIFGGTSALKEGGYFKIYQEEPVDVRWKNLMGVDTEFNREWFTARLVYIQSTNQYNSDGTGWGDYSFNVGSETQQQIMGLALNFDFEKFYVLTETNLILHHGDLVKYDSPSYSLGAGYRLGSLTPFLNYSSYADSTSTPETFEPQSFDEWTATLRYDLATGQDVKIQYNWYRDLSPALFTGHTQMLSLSYDISL